MEFTDWLKKQTHRYDQVGWVSRLLYTSSNKKFFVKEALARENPEYVLSQYKKGGMEGSKIYKSLFQANTEWKLAGRPEIGIFWVLDGDIVEFSQAAASIEVLGGVKDVPYDHMRQWSQMQHVFPQLREKEYDEIPRGRVIGIGADKYRIFISPEDNNNASLISNIMKVFNLPRNKTEVMADEHYIVDYASKMSLFDEDDEDYNDFE